MAVTWYVSPVHQLWSLSRGETPTRQYDLVLQAAKCANGPANAIVFTGGLTTCTVMQPYASVKQSQTRVSRSWRWFFLDRFAKQFTFSFIFAV